MDRDLTSGESSHRPAADTRSDRLNSWKAISGYLRKDERTLRRWEQSEGLPIHRHAHDKKSTVYAYKSELEAWLQTRRTPASSDAGAQRPRGRNGGPWLVALAVVAVLVAAATAAWLLDAGRQQLAFEERDWILITDFDNYTGDSSLDGIVDYALTHALNESGYVNVVPRTRTEDALRLMGRPLDTTITPSIGQEVALRDGSVRALLSGRVTRLGTAFVIDANLIDPSDGATVEVFREEAADGDELRFTVDRLSTRIRERLGESLATIEGADRLLAPVTTPSLKALQLYSKADSLMLSSEPQQAIAEVLLREALQEDPDFASAHTHLGYALSNQRHPPEVYAPHFQRGRELSGSSSERERLFIEASYQHRVTKDHDTAVTTYKALLEVHPDHFWAIANLSSLLRKMGQVEEALAYSVRQADLLPNRARSNAWAARGLIATGAEPDRYEPYLHRAQRAYAALAPNADSLAVIVSLYPYYPHWLRGEVDEALAIIDTVASTPEDRIGRPNLLASYVRSGHLSLGRFRGHADEAMWFLLTGQQATPRADRQSLHDSMVRQPLAYWKGQYFAEMGDLANVQEVLRLALERGPTPSDINAITFDAMYNKVLKGEIELLKGNSALGIQLLEQGVKALYDHRIRIANPNFLRASIRLAIAHERSGDTQRAIEVLRVADEDAREHRSGFITGGPIWLALQNRLAQMLRAAGRAEEAEVIDDRLRMLLAAADEDFYIPRRLGAEGDIASN